MHWMPIVLLALAVVAVQPSAAEINSSFVVEVIRKLSNVYNIDTIPIFTIRPIEPDGSLLADLPQQLAQENLSPQMIFVDYSTQELSLTIDRSALSIVLTDQMPTDVLRLVTDRLRGMHMSKMLMVFRNPVVLQQLTYFQKWLWETQFANVLLLYEDQVTQENQIFTIDPYPTLKWANRTAVSDPSKLFMEDNRDKKQYLIEIPFIEDAPRVFTYWKHGKEEMVGRHARLITLFAKHMNIKLICNYERNLDLDKILRELHNKDMELSVHPYSMFDLEEIGSSYPLETVRWCIMVPLRSEVAKKDYVVIAFDWATWLVICVSVIYIGFLMQFIDPPTEYIQKWYFLRTLAIVIYSPNMAERMVSPTIRQFVFFSFVFLLGFMLSCFYSTYVTLYCTNMVFQPPIDSIDDLVKENLRVMVIDYELEAIRERARYGETFLKLLYPVSYFEVVSRRNNFDSRYAYSIRQDRWNFLDKQQRGLEKPFFRLSNICFGRHFTMFPLQSDSHLQPHLDNFILLVMQSGLDLFWDEEAFRMAVTTKFARVLVEQTVVVQPLRLDYFIYVFAVWCVGISISAVVFAIEVLYTKFILVKKALERDKAFENCVAINIE